MTMRMALTRAYVRWRYRARHDLDRMQLQLPERQQEAPVPAEVEELCDVVRVEVGGRPVVTLTPRRASPSGAHLVHLHGGAYVYAIQERHWRALARLAVASGATVHVPLYALAPSADVGDACVFLDRVLADLRSRAPASSVFLGGDSAGGGLALALAIRRRDAGDPPLAGLVLFSPWLDVSLDDPAIARLERRDPMLSRTMLRLAGRWWAGGRGTADPLVSPVRGELSGLPPVTTYIGGRDILLPDAATLHRRLREAGGSSVLRVWPGGFHVFMGALKTKESSAVIADAARLLRSESPDQSVASGIG